jgi:hypothetical protein
VRYASTWLAVPGFDQLVSVEGTGDDWICGCLGGSRLSIRRLAVIISGAFVYQPPGGEGVFATGAGFSIALVVLNDDGTSVFTGGPGDPTLGASVQLSYPQTPDSILEMTKVEVVESRFLLATATLTGPPPAGWMPAALLISVNGFPYQIITAAAPAVADSGIVEPGPVRHGL